MAADVSLPPGFELDPVALPPGFELDPAPAAAAPKPNRVLDTAMRLGRGLMTGGPVGLIGAGVREGLQGLDTVGEMAGDKTVDTLAGMGASPEVAAGIGTVVKMAPSVLVGGTGGAKAGAPVMEAGAKRLMQSALKPSAKSLANKDAAQAIDTMLKEGVNATTGGALKLRQLITKLKGEVTEEISKHPGALVDKAHVYRELQSTLDDVSKLARPDAPREAVMKAWEAFRNHPLASGGIGLQGGIPRRTDAIPVQLADEMKRATQRSVKDAYGRITSTPIDDKIDMAMAAGLRKGVEEAVPPVAGMNAKLSEYINALHQIEPKAAIAANQQLGGLVPLAHSPEAAMIMLADRNPWMKSYIARALYQGRRAVPAGAGAITAVSAGEEEGRP